MCYENIKTLHILIEHGTVFSWNMKTEVRRLNKIKFYRNNLGLSVYKVAELSELTPSYISNLENDNRTNPSREAMQKISNALNESVQAVFFPDDADSYKTIIT